jgi:hypothetical protein
MIDTFTFLLMVNITLLSLLTVVVLILVVVVLLMIRRSLIKFDAAVENVEDATMRSLAPLLSLRSMFTDVGSFIETVKAWGTAFSRKPKRLKEK